MTSIKNWIAALCLAFALLAAGCGTQNAAKPSGPAKEYAMRGQITGLDAGGHMATIKHENIPGFMSAMTMGYPVKDPGEFSKLKVGDAITATVYVKDDDMWVGNIRKADAPGPKN